MNSNVIIILDGDLSESLITRFIKQNSPRDSFIMFAADGASNKLFKYKIAPDYIIGDLDSASQTSLKYFKEQGTKIKRIKNQEHNDFEKCLNFSYSKNHKNIVVLGYSGGRIDHLINNLSVFKKFSSRSNIKLLDESLEILYVNKSIKFIYKENELVSLIAFPTASGIKTSGLRYKLNSKTLEFGKQEGALNSSTSTYINIEYKKGSLFIIKKHFDNLHFD